MIDEGSSPGAGASDAAGRTAGDPEATRRARLTAGIAIVLGVASISLAAVQLARGGIPAAVIAAAVGVLAFALAFALRLRVSVTLVASLVLLLWGCVLAGSAAMRGGVGSPGATALATLPMLALLMLGTRGAIACSGAVTLLVVALTVGTQRGAFVDMVAPSLQPALGAIGTVALGAALLAVGLVYERRRNAALAELVLRDERLRAGDRERLAAEAVSKMARAEHLASIGQLAAGASHEINNPLSYLLYNLHALEEHFAGAARLEREDCLQMVRDALDGGRHIQRVIHDLNTYSRTEDETVESIDLHAVVETVLSMADNEIRHRAKIVRDFGDIPPVVANRARAGQILLNLVINAAHAIPEGKSRDGTITISTRTSGEDDQEVTVEVRDTGTGIDPDTLRRVTEPFFTTKPIGVGTGLGLPASVNLIQRLGGRFEIESEVGVGTTVRFTLRRAHGAPVPARAQPLAPTVAATLPVRLLVIDDDVNVTRALQRMLNKHDTVVARSGAEALELLRRDDGFDLVLCDLMMPEMTGVEVYQALARDNPALASRVVLMTGGAFSSGARDFLSGFPGRVLEKPFPRETLLELVANAGKHAKSA